MSEYEFTVSLQIRHPSIDPELISSALGVEPQHTWRAGAPRLDQAHGELGGVHRESYWMGRLMDEPQLSSAVVSVEQVIEQTLDHLRSCQRFLEQLNAESASAELFVSLYARTDFRLELPASCLALLGRLHLAVALEIHPYTPRAFTAPRTH